MMLIALLAAALATPAQFSTSGRITDASGQPIHGNTELGFYVYDSQGAAQGAHLWSSSMTVPVDGGYYNVILGDDAFLELLDESELWLEVHIDGTPFAGRTPLLSVPFAARATQAEGGAPPNPGASCADILTDDASATSGMYWIDPGAGSAYRVYCDMDTLGGGWELVFNLDTSDGTARGYTDYGFWTSRADLGDPEAPFAGDYKSGRVFDTAHEDLLVLVHRNGEPVGWRGWNLSADRSLRQFLQGDSTRNPVSMTGAQLGADVAGIDEREVIVRPNGGLYVNQVWGNASSFDIARLRSTTLPSNDNTNWGMGMLMDAQNYGGTEARPGSPYYPSCDAGTSTTWSGYLCMGDDIECVNCGSLNGSGRGLAYDYAVFVRNPVSGDTGAPALAGNSEATAASSCDDLHTSRPSAPSGRYWVDVGGTPAEVYCDMETNGGGWTLLMNLDTSDGAVRYYRDDAFWEGSEGAGSLDDALTRDFKSASAFSAGWSNVMIRVHREDVQTLGWRSWSMATGTRFIDVLGQGTARGGNQFTSATTGADVSGLSALELVVRPVGNLRANQIWGNTDTFDVSRIRNTSGGTTNNTDWALGTQMDAQNRGGTNASPGLPLYPGCDAGADVAWSGYICFGTDLDCTTCGNVEDGGKDLAYDYAIYVK